MTPKRKLTGSWSPASGFWRINTPPPPWVSRPCRRYARSAPPKTANKRRPKRAKTDGRAADVEGSWDVLWHGETCGHSGRMFKPSVSWYTFGQLLWRNGRGPISLRQTCSDDNRVPFRVGIRVRFLSALLGCARVDPIINETVDSHQGGVLF